MYNWPVAQVFTIFERHTMAWMTTYIMVKILDPPWINNCPYTPNHLFYQVVTNCCYQYLCSCYIPPFSLWHCPENCSYTPISCLKILSWNFWVSHQVWLLINYTLCTRTCVCNAFSLCMTDWKFKNIMEKGLCVCSVAQSLSYKIMACLVVQVRQLLPSPHHSTHCLIK